MATSIGERAAQPRPFPVPLPLAVAGVVYLTLILLGARLLGDPDIYWHIVVGRWIAEHRTFPHADLFSHTMLGAPWIAKEWLSQILYAGAYAFGGWTAVAALAAATAALALALLARFLREALAPAPVLVMVAAALVLAAPHLIARPHMLALPVMVAFVGGLVRALDRGRAPSLALLPLMTLWANLHGGFTLGLALIVPLAAEAVWSARGVERRALALRWVIFGLLAGLAACITPYGAESILITYRIFGLGEALSIVAEWRPQDFGKLGAFELCLLLALGYALHRGLTLPPVRILLVLGLLHLALAHVRNSEVLGLLAPLFIAAPLARQLAGRDDEEVRAPMQPLAVAAVVALLAALTAALGVMHRLAPADDASPARAVEVIKDLNAGPVLNDYHLGAYLVHAGVPSFIDGRTELFGGAFTARHHRAVTLQDVGDFLKLLDEYRIGATLLMPQTPAVGLLDRLGNWTRVYADGVAVVHVRRAGPATIDSAPKAAP